MYVHLVASSNFNDVGLRRDVCFCLQVQIVRFLYSAFNHCLNIFAFSSKKKYYNNGFIILSELCDGKSVLISIIL